MKSKSYATVKEAHFPCLFLGQLPKLSRWNLDVGSKLLSESKLVSAPTPIRAAVQLWTSVGLAWLDREDERFSQQILPQRPSRLPSWWLCWQWRCRFMGNVCCAWSISFSHGRVWWKKQDTIWGVGWLGRHLCSKLNRYLLAVCRRESHHVLYPGPRSMTGTLRSQLLGCERCIANAFSMTFWRDFFLSWMFAYFGTESCLLQNFSRRSHQDDLDELAGSRRHACCV